MANDDTGGSATNGLRVRPLRKEDARQVGLLTRQVTREFGAEPILSVEATIDLFETGWLERGSGLVLEDRNKLAGYGWTRDSEWNGGRYVHVGLFLRSAYRSPSAFRVITDPLLEMTEQIGRRYRTPAALAFFRSVDTVHPPIVRSLGFRDIPTAMVGFRHDLKRIDTPDPVPGLLIRPARIPEEKKVLLEMSHLAFDDRPNQGEPLHVQYLDLFCSRPGFVPEQILIAELDGKPVGHAVLHLNDGSPNDNSEVCQTAVLPEFRGRRIGPSLVCRMLEWCRDRGANTVLAGSFSTSPAATMCWRVGFRPDPFRTYYYFVKELVLP